MPDPHEDEPQLIDTVKTPDPESDPGENVEEIGEPLFAALAYGDAVMVKGSNGVGLSGIVNKIRDRFDRN